jgi:abelson tyrosine-protein kinase 1
VENKALQEGITTSHLSLSDPSHVMLVLTSLHSHQNSLDTATDTTDLCELMRAALQTTSDVKLLEVLQVGHQDMPEAIKTLQRALERITERDDLSREKPALYSMPVVAARVAKKVSLKEAEPTPLGQQPEDNQDDLNREFIERGIDALRRMSRGNETSLPSWTITK